MPERPTASKQALAHLPAVDGVRGVAIALVVAHHLGHFVPLPEPLHTIAERGFIGVDLFFVLSGYLITTILLYGRGRPDQLRVFWIRRVLRIVPLAYLYLVVLFVLHGVLRWPDGREIPWQIWASGFGYVSNIWYALNGWPPEGTLAILWSLSVEEQFYLLWPLLVRWLRPRWVGVVAIAVVIASPFARLWAAEVLGNTASFVLTLGRFDGLAMGGLLALVLQSSMRDRVLRASRWLVIPASVVAYLVAGPELWGSAHLWHQSRPTSLALCFVLIVAASVEPGPIGKWVLGNRPLRRLGEVSYGVYVWHYVLLLVTMRLLGTPGAHPVPLIVTWLLGLWAVSQASFRYWERPFLALKARLAS